MCFAPQRRALFEHLIFQKCPTLRCFVRFYFEKKTASTFSTSQLPKVVLDCSFFTLLTSKSAPRHNGVQFLISHLARWLLICGCSLLFDPPEPQIIGKNTVNRDFSTCSCACIFFPLTLSLLWSSFFFSSLPFSSLTLPTSAFPSGHVVGSLTSKLPSNIYQ